MNDTIIAVEGLSKRYRLGQIGVRTLSEAVQRWWHGAHGRDPDLHMGVVERDVAIGRHSGAPRRAAGEARPEVVWALRDVSFEVRRGEVLGIIGRNGAGKSTLLKILTRITDPTAGRAVLRGRVASLLEVGTGFHPELTGRENVYLNGAILGMKKKEIDDKFEEIVAFSEVGQFIDTPVKRYSSGMYVRLAFAVAAHLEPKILLVDEVLAVGDLGFQRKCLGKMESVAKAGRTVLFVSHNMAAIQALCSRAILLESGRLVCDAGAQETVGAYVVSVQKLIEEQPLEQRTDRQGGDVFRFRNVVFRDVDTGAPQNVLICGQPVRIDIGYTCHSPNTLSDVVVAIAFTSTGGTLLSACRSDVVGKTYRIQSGEGHAVCRIAKLPFSQGRFNYSLIAYRQGVVIDWVREAGTVDVVAGDYYGTGRIPAQGSQSVLIDFDWETA